MKSTSAKSSPQSFEPLAGLRRSQTNRIIAGVAGGIGEYFGIDPTIIRIIFIVITLLGGSGVLLYLILWLIIPSAEGEADFSVDSFKSEVKERIHQFRNNPDFASRQNSRFWWGLFILVVGVLILFKNLGLLDGVDFTTYWPLLLVVLGLMVIFK